MPAVRFMTGEVPLPFAAAVFLDLARRSKSKDELAQRRIDAEVERFEAWLDEMAQRYGEDCPDLAREDAVVLFRWDTRARLQVVK